MTEPEEKPPDTQAIVKNGNGSAMDMDTIYQTFLEQGDLSKLDARGKNEYILNLCKTLGLNPLTRPFRWIKTDSGKYIPYCTRDATDQLRKNHNVSIEIVERTHLPEPNLYIVTARGRDGTGRTDESTGAVCLTGLSGESLANALMKAETKAKRRVTLSICGLGFMDEIEAITVGLPTDAGTDAPRVLTPRAETPVAKVSDAFSHASPPAIPHSSGVKKATEVKKAHKVPSTEDLEAADDDGLPEAL